MSKKHSSTQGKVNPPITITVTLPDEGEMPRTGQILVQRGALATIGQFTYMDLAGISQAIQDAAVRLIQLEQNPPPDDVNLQPSTPDEPPVLDTEAEPEDVSTNEADSVEVEEREPEQPTQTNSQQSALF
jgi:hypothetical protein